MKPIQNQIVFIIGVLVIDEQFIKTKPITCYLQMSLKQPYHLYSITTALLKNNSQHRLLEITFDDSLTFEPHITNVCLKLSRIVSLLYKVKALMPLHVLKIICNEHILPILSQCMPIWYNTYPTHLLTLFRLQKKIIKIITNSDFLEQSLPLLTETNILTLCLK